MGGACRGRGMLLVRAGCVPTVHADRVWARVHCAECAEGSVQVLCGGALGGGVEAGA